MQITFSTNFFNLVYSCKAASLSLSLKTIVLGLFSVQNFAVVLLHHITEFSQQLMFVYQLTELLLEDLSACRSRYLGAS